MKEKSNYDGEQQPLTEIDKTQIMESDKISENVKENIPKDELTYKLPKKQNIKFDFDFEDPENEFTDKEKEILKINKDYMESKLWYWKLDNRFKFDLPPTVFKEKKIIDQDEGFQYSKSGLRYKNPSIIGRGFSCDILNQIWYEGEFYIESNVPNFPYVWHITECMIKGYEKVKDSYANILSIAFMFLYTLKYRFISDSYKEFCVFCFQSAFFHLYNSFIRLIDLLFGIPKYFCNIESAKKEIMHQRLANFINNNSDFDFDFFNEETKNELKKFDEKFESKWIQEIQPSLISQYATNKNEEMMNDLRTKKLEEYLKFLDNNEKFIKFEKSHPCSKDYLLSQQILNEKEYTYNSEKNKKIEKYESKLKNNYVRSLCSLWLEDKMESYESSQEKKTNEKIQTEVNNEIKDKKDPKAIYNFNINNKNEIPNLAKQYANKKKIPKFKHNLSRKCCCYKKIQVIDSNKHNRYQLEKEINYEINSTFFFWRIILFIIKYFYDFWTFNIVIFRNMVNSMFGIKALFLTELYRDYDVDHISGVIEETDKTITFPSSVINLWIMVQNSREEFENAPDTGILGKGCMRLFHLFYNYVLILFFLGILLIIFYPLMIILNIIICIILIILSPILIIIWTILDYIFTLVIYNRFDEELNITPIIFIILIELTFGFAIQFFLIFLAIFLQPIISLIIFIFAQIYFVARIIHNCFFISIIACFGRIPQSDSCVAWQTSGPGMFSDRYYDISNIDIICLVRGYLEKIILKNYAKKIGKMLESPKEQILDIQGTFGMLGFKFVFTENFEESIKFYKNKLNEQIESRNIYPEINLRVKFTQERLQKVKYMISIYITEYSKAYDISQELNKYKKIDNFVEEILKSIFGYNILVPLESSEKLTHLKSVFDNQLDLIATKIFQNPYFQDKIIVEEEIDNKIKSSKNELGGPKAANFEQVFKGDLNLNFSPLTEKDKELLLSRSENLINIKFKS